VHIYVDADACPNVIKEVLFRAAQRTGTPLTLVANQALRVPPSPLLRAVRVASGFDAADGWIEAHVAAGDLVITADIPLAAAAIDKGARALGPRGELYTGDNVRQRLVMRDLMDELRGTGMDVGGGPPPLSQQARRAFASQLDRLLAGA
jgi:hypothetical protein